MTQTDATTHATTEATTQSAPAELHPLLARRWSPTSFDATSEISDAELDSLVEAARWAPSAGNSQPWAFIVARRGERDHDRLVANLARSSAAWAPSAGALVANLSHVFVEDTDWEYSEFSLYDLGQAVAHMTFQAQSLGLHVRQFRAFDRDALTREFAIPPHWQVSTMSAIGRVAPDAARPHDARPVGARPVGARPVGARPDEVNPARQRQPRESLRWPT